MNGRIDLSDLKYGRFTEAEIQKLALRGGDLLIIRSNGSLDLVGRTALRLNCSMRMIDDPAQGTGLVVKVGDQRCKLCFGNRVYRGHTLRSLRLWSIGRQRKQKRWRFPEGCDTWV
jgi:hypothetical protein